MELNNIKSEREICVKVSKFNRKLLKLCLQETRSRISEFIIELLSDYSKNNWYITGT
jgi:hypothetical protein